MRSPTIPSLAVLAVALASCTPPRAGQSGSELGCTPGAAGDAECQSALGDGFVCGASGTCEEASDPDVDWLRLYMNFDGVDLVPGDADDASQNVAALLEQPATIPPLQPAWFDTDKDKTEIQNDIIYAVQQLYAPFKLKVVPARPVAAPYVMAVVGGGPEEIGISSSSVMSIAPIDCFNAHGDSEIVFAFDESITGFSGYDKQVNVMATNIAREVAYTLGLSSSDSCEDVMEPSAPSCGDKAFVNLPLDCPDLDCICGGSEQNSYQAMAEALGTVN